VTMANGTGRGRVPVERLGEGGLGAELDEHMSVHWTTLSRMMLR
jgi:hypothetical protein